MNDKRYFLIAERNSCPSVHELRGSQYMKAAIEDAEYLIKRQYNTNDNRLSRATIYEVSATDVVNLESVYRRFDEERAIANADEKELAEREMLTKLMAKYPNAVRNAVAK